MKYEDENIHKSHILAKSTEDSKRVRGGGGQYSFTSALTFHAGIGHNNFKRGYV